MFENAAIVVAVKITHDGLRMNDRFYFELVIEIVGSIDGRGDVLLAFAVSLVLSFVKYVYHL